MVFTFFINIVMLNLLIALMGDIFDRIQENARNEFLFARGSIILEFENMMSAGELNNKAWFPTWLQILEPAAGSDESKEDEDWAGRLTSVKHALKTSEEITWSKLNELNAKLEASETRGDNLAVILSKVASKLDIEPQLLSSSYSYGTSPHRKSRKSPKKISPRGFKDGFEDEDDDEKEED